MPRQGIEHRFAQAVTAGNLLARDEVLAAGVSGGADSVAMLYLLCWLNQQPGWSLTIHVLHLNHQLRGPEASQDAAFVQDLAKELRLPCVVESVDVSGYAEQHGVSIEQAARQCRFAFFERQCLRLGARAVCLAHHADDNAETILHRIVRGTGIRGLGGIRPVRPIREGSNIRVVRPLLALRHSELEQFLRDRQLSWCHDRTNDSPSHTRNRIRHQVLPLLGDQFNPQVVEALARLAEQARGLDAYLDETGRRMLDSLIVEHTDRALVLHGPSLIRKPRIIQTELIRKAILLMGVGEGDLTYEHLNAVAELAATQEGTKTLNLPGDLRVSRRYSRLVFERPSNRAAEADPALEVRVETNGTTVLPAHGLLLSVEEIPVDETTVAAYLQRSRGRGHPCNDEWIDADQVHPPLLARSRRPGDRFWPLGMNGLKKVSDFLIDEKIDARLRQRTVLLCDRLGPIWVVPLRIDHRVRLTPVTRRVLHLLAKPMSEYP